MINRIVALSISVVVRGVDLLGAAVGRLSRGPRRCSGTVLYYHAIKPNQRERFARQMDQLTDLAHAFPAGSPEAMRPGRQNVAVTFDDGFRSVVDNALPEVAKRRIPVTMFVPSGCLGERPSWVRSPSHPSWGERVLSAAELRELARHPLVTLGSHSVTHPNLLNLDATGSARELLQSKAELEAAAGIPIELFSFPHGAHTVTHLEQARQAGYRRVFTIEPSTVSKDPDLFKVGRVATDPEDWPFEFRLKLAGAYRWRCHLGRGKLRL